MIDSYGKRFKPAGYYKGKPIYDPEELAFLRGNL